MLMTREAHSSAPWTQERDVEGRRVIYSDACALVVAEVQTEADARLIAAAPDMLAAARLGLMAAMEAAAYAGSEGHDGTMRENLKRADALRAAIAKAEGRS